MKFNFKQLRASLAGKKLAKPTLAIVAIALPASVGLGYAAATVPGGSLASNASESSASGSVQPESSYQAANLEQQSDAGASGNSASASVNSSITSSHSVTSQTTISSSGNGGSASVTVNGQPINLPANGSVSKTIQNPDGGQTNVDVNVSGNGETSASSSGTSSINLNVSSNSTSGD